MLLKNTHVVIGPRIFPLSDPPWLIWYYIPYLVSDVLSHAFPLLFQLLMFYPPLLLGLPDGLFPELLLFNGLLAVLGILWLRSAGQLAWIVTDGSWY